MGTPFIWCGITIMPAHVMFARNGTDEQGRPCVDIYFVAGGPVRTWFSGPAGRDDARCLLDRRLGAR